MSTIFYAQGEPQGSIANYTWYMDLDTDTMYELVNDEWIVRSRNGEEVEQIFIKEKYRGISNDL